MKLIVSEVGSLGSQADRAFELPIIKVGRDSVQCQIVFDRVTWPMVSRFHGEFRLEQGKCLFVDANSTCGTFLNGQRLKGAVEVLTGALIQFGAGGPFLQVKSLETAAGALSLDEVGESLKNERTNSRLQVTAPLKLPIPSTTPTATIELEGGGTGVNARIALEFETTPLGRDAASALPLDSQMVSRHHAEIRRANGRYVLFDLSSYNGTFVNGEHIHEPFVLSDKDRIQLGTNGPTLRFIDPTGAENKHAKDHRDSREAILPSIPIANAISDAAPVQETLVATPDVALNLQQPTRLENNHAQPVLRLNFNKPYISVGRGADNDIRLDSLQVSVQHARFIKDQNGVLIEERNSTNGVYINGERIPRGRQKVEECDFVQIGPFLLQADSEVGVAVFDTRAKTRIDVIDINKVLVQRGGKSQKLLDAVNLSIQPNQFVGLLGSSGAGKSTLMNVLAGMSSPSAGQVLVNDLDLYRHLDSLKQLIGYVPQNDIIHRELTVYRTLLYVAQLRLCGDVSSTEIDEIIDEVLEVTGLTERRDVPVGQLSGGQRKRVSIAVELITTPSIIFLDEPTSGLDPATEEKIMKLFRRITESGRTVVLTTHNTVNVRLFDKIVVVMHGKVVFYGAPDEALAHFHVSDFNDLYEALQNPGNPDNRLKLVQPRAKQPAGVAPNHEDSEAVAERWKRRFEESDLFRRNVQQHLREVNPGPRPQPIPTRRLKITTDGMRQWMTLARRYVEILFRDWGMLLVLLGQAPVIALLTYMVIDEKATRDFPYFMLALSAMWFGTSVSAREIIRERAVYNRERMFNLRLLSYVASKVTVLAIVVTLQCFLLLATIKLLHYTHLTYLPGSYSSLPHLLVMIVTGTIGVALGLFVSAIVKSSQTATSVVPLLLIPQILFAGLVAAPKGAAKLTGAAMPVTWSFDQMKRLSQLQTLNEEGSIAKFLEEQSKQQSEQTSWKLENFNSEIHKAVDQYHSRIEEYINNARTTSELARPEPPKLPSPPTLPETQPEGDLREFVSFTHPWGSVAVNWGILFVMLAAMVAATTMVLRVQDRK